MADRNSQPDISPDPGSSRHLNHKVSILSDSPYDDPAEPHGRESLVSLLSIDEATPSRRTTSDENPYNGTSWTALFTDGSGGRYLPISAPAASITRSGSRLKSFRARAQDTIHEDESIDMSLLKAAAPLGRSSSDGDPGEDEFAEPVIDMTSFSGPMGAYDDDEFLKSLQEQEANGKLTGGIGEGITPQTTIKGEQLVQESPKSPMLKRSFTQSLSMRRKPSKSPSSKTGWKELGQSRANETGEVIEVIIEEPPDIVDLSNMVGPTAVGTDSDRIRHSTLPSSTPKSQIFYPQPNWKPFWMRWPYLALLITLSITLAICQEVLYQRAAREPLIRFERATDIDPAYYFAFKFLPTIVTVTYGVLWTNTDFEVRRLEAFFQMSKEGGALAAESINVDYVTLFALERPFRALQRKHYAVAVSSIATLLAVSLVPTLGSAAFLLNPGREARIADPDQEKTITVSATLSRLLTATFLIIAALGSVLFYQLHTRRTGLLSDVRGIAGLASMAVVSHVMMDFKDTDVAKPKNIHHKLKNHRYVLRNSSLAREDATRAGMKESDKYGDARLPENPHPVMMRAEGCIPFIVGILLFAAFVPIFLFTPASVLTEKAPWIITALAVSIKLGWGSLETAIKMMEPYYILSKRHAPAKTLVLDYTAIPFAAVAFRALLNRHWIVFLVGWGTVLVEGLTIFVTSLATVEGKEFLAAVGAGDGDSDTEVIDEGLGAGSETVRSFVVTLTFALFILLYLSVVATIVFFRRRHPFLPRQPSTIASVLAFMHQSKMIYDFVGTAKYTTAQVRGKLEEIGKTYGLGWFDGRDGQTHCGVDEEELTGNYKHGIDYSRGNKPWTTEWQLF